MQSAIPNERQAPPKPSPAPSRSAGGAGESRGVRHLFTVDVEEHFHVSAFEKAIPRAMWSTQPERAVASTERLLALLAEHDTRATFFVLGWVAARQPDLVRRIAGLGHEVASHGWWHYRVNTIDRATFRDEVTRSRHELESLTGRPVRGYRAPSFSITPGTEWAFDVLLEAGYQYDSSLFPIRRPGYGYPSAPRHWFSVERPGGTLLELPMTTLAVGPFRVPAAGGGYLRQLPLALVRRAFRQSGARGEPGMFYVHPWEVDPDQPRVAVGPLTGIRHYRGLSRTMPRLRALLSEFRFTSIEDALAESTFVIRGR